MDQGDPLPARWYAVIEALSVERGWDLHAGAIQRYLQALHGLLPPTCTESELRRVCGYYHNDHHLVEALRQSRNPHHSARWTTWIGQVPAILRKAGVHWSSDSAVDGDDLAQVAQAALVAALPTFAYRSSFSTWAHTVVVQSVQRYLRDSRARKRAQRPESLEASPAIDAPARDEDEPECRAAFSMLIDQIRTILIQAGDERLACIFHLWAVADRSTEEIGRLLQLHPSRVRALLAQARALLQHHPAIQHWLLEIDVSFRPPHLSWLPQRRELQIERPGKAA